MLERMVASLQTTQSLFIASHSCPGGCQNPRLLFRKCWTSGKVAEAILTLLALHSVLYICILAVAAVRAIAFHALIPLL